MLLFAVAAAGFFAWQAHRAEQSHQLEQHKRDEEIKAERQAVALEKAVTATLNGQNDLAEQQIAAAA
jgi:hypothetical protein